MESEDLTGICKKINFNQNYHNIQEKKHQFKLKPGGHGLKGIFEDYKKMLFQKENHCQHLWCHFE